MKKIMFIYLIIIILVLNFISYSQNYNENQRVNFNQKQLSEDVSDLLESLKASSLVDPNICLWVPNHDSNSVTKINTETNSVIATIPVATNPCFICVGKEFVYVTHLYSQKVYRISKIYDIVVDSIDVSSYLANLEGIAVNSQNEIFIVGTINFLHDAEGEYTRIIKCNSEGDVVLSKDLGKRLNRRIGIGIGLNDNGVGYISWLYPQHKETGVMLFYTETLDFTIFELSYLYYRKVGIGIDQNGSCWTFGARSNTQSYTELTSDGVITNTIFSTTIEASGTGGVTVDSLGRIWASTDSGLFRITPQTEITHFDVGAVRGGITIDKNGYLWAVFPDSNKVKKFNLEGVQVGASVEVGFMPYGYGDMTGYQCKANWETCCLGIRGNVDGDALDQIDISDLVGLVAYMFQGGAEPPCMEEADINGSGGIDISDLSGLVSYMFQGGVQPADCPI